jgi:hypothetical protein
MLKIEWQAPLKIHISGVFKNKRSVPDLHNLKCLYDAIQTATGINDRFYYTETEPGVIDKIQEPHILIRIEEE